MTNNSNPTLQKKSILIELILGFYLVGKWLYPSLLTVSCNTPKKLGTNETYESNLIAPCGMNCGICMAYQRKTSVCKGCRGDNGMKRPHCISCRIRNCEILVNTESGFCYECPTYPCNRLRKLDKRYREKYKMSMIANLDAIKSNGLDLFVQQEQIRWNCPTCGGTICVHTGYCLKCN